MEFLPATGVTTLADLFGKLSIVQGAVKAACAMRTMEAAERQNRRVEREWDEFNRSG